MINSMKLWWSKKLQESKQASNFPDKLEQFLDQLFVSFANKFLKLVVLGILTSILIIATGMISFSDEIKSRYIRFPIISLLLYKGL